MEKPVESYFSLRKTLVFVIVLQIAAIFVLSILNANSNKVEQALNPRVEGIVSNKYQTLGDPNNDPEFTIVALPDIQFYSTNDNGIALAQTQWIFDNLTNLNIKMVLGEGDLVNASDNGNEWIRAMNAMNILKNNNIPNLLAIGNHDYDNQLETSRADTIFNSHIVYSDWYGSKAWFDGGSFETDNSLNVYTKMNIGNLRFLFLMLELWPRQDVIDWAKLIVENNPTYRVVIVTHGYLYEDGTTVDDPVDHYGPSDFLGLEPTANDGEDMWNELVKVYPNIAMVLSGHYDGVAYLTRLGNNGNPVHQILADYQGGPNGGDGYLRYYTFKPIENKIYVYTYSPTLDSFNTAANNQFILDYSLDLDPTNTPTNTSTDIPTDTPTNNPIATDTVIITNTTTNQTNYGYTRAYVPQEAGNTYLKGSDIPKTALISNKVDWVLIGGGLILMGFFFSREYEKVNKRRV